MARLDDLDNLIGALVAAPTCWSPSFSPDGSSMAFVCERDGRSSIRILSLADGTTRDGPAVADPIGIVVWGRERALFVDLKMSGGARRQVARLSLDDGRLQPLLASDDARTSAPADAWLRPGFGGRPEIVLATNRRDAAHMDAVLLDATTLDEVLATRAEGLDLVTDARLHPPELIVRRVIARGREALILRTAAHEIQLADPGPGGSVDDALRLPDGRIVFRSNLDRDRMALFSVSPVSETTWSPPRLLTSRDDADLARLAWRPETTDLLLVWSRDGCSSMEWFDVVNGETRPFPFRDDEAPCVIARADFAPRATHVAITWSTPTQPYTISVVPLETDTHRLTVSSPPGRSLPRASLLDGELVRFEAHDGLPLTGWLYRPRVDTRRAVLSFHGGPEDQERPAFNPLYQALLAAGIAVLAPNIRGSTGFGRRFATLDDGPRRAEAIRDAESCARLLERLGLVDLRVAGRTGLGAIGESYGGFMALSAAARYPALFDACVSVSGIVDFADFFARTTPWMAAISTLEYGDPVKDAELLRELSPLHRLDAIRAATLFVHGVHDTNVPPDAARRASDRLRARGVRSKFLGIDDGHGILQGPHQRRVILDTVSWLNEGLEGA